MSLKRFVFISALPPILVLAGGPSRAAPPAALPDSARPSDTLSLGQATVIGRASRIRSLPGSAQLLTRVELDRQRQSDLIRALAEVPGVVVQEEEGFGLRPNISLRGTDPERSRNVTVLEDGILIAPAPYSAPSIHILPPVGRLEGVEILKGSSQIKYGPRTQGGVVNLLSTPIPDAFSAYVDLASGTGDQGRVHAHAGDSRAHFGYLVEFYRDGRDGFQELPGGEPTGYDLSDYLAKVRLNTHPDGDRYQELEVKVVRNSQTSHSSYLGLSDADFGADPYARYAGSGNDRWDSEWRSVQARYAFRPLAWLDVNVAAYRHSLERNWYKVAAAAGTPIATLIKNPSAYPAGFAALRGSGSASDTLDLEGNQRDFEAAGVQGTAVFRQAWGGLRNETELGVRFHRDEENRREYTDKWLSSAGNLVLARKGSAGDRGNRLGEAEAWAFHAQDRVQWGDWGLVPGLRIESISLERSNWGKDLDRSGNAVIDRSRVNALAWGLGGTYNPDPLLSLFLGLHRGISPPVPGNSDSAEAERSLNYELGLRSRAAAAGIEVTGFLNDFQNLLGTELAAGGGLSTERQFNGGKAWVYGLEAAFRWDAGESGRQLGMPLPFGLSFRAAYTFTRGEFRSSFKSELEQWLSVKRGDELPYIPAHQFAGGAGLQYRALALDVMGKYVGEMRTAAGQGSISYAQSAGDFSFVDATLEVALVRSAKLYASARNVFDDVGLASRNPAGARPTLPRTLSGGIKSGF